MRKFLARLGLVSAIVAATVLVPTVEANAVWQCRSWGQWPIYGYATCDFGLGGVRVIGRCWYPNNGQIDTFYGPWVSAGQTSTVICNGGSYINSTSYQTF
jgi:hypothetical protein